MQFPVFYSKFSENNEGFKEFAESLKVNKVTCETLIMYESHWPNEDCSEIVEVLKPVTVAMNSERCDRYTAVFGSTTLVGFPNSYSFFYLKI